MCQTPQNRDPTFDNLTLKSPYFSQYATNIVAITLLTVKQSITMITSTTKRSKNMKPLYRIQERENPQSNWMTIDSFTSKAKAEKYCKEYQAYKPTSEFRVLAQVLN